MKLHEMLQLWQKYQDLMIVRGYAICDNDQFVVYRSGIHNPILHDVGILILFIRVKLANSYGFTYRSGMMGGNSDSNGSWMLRFHRLK